MAQLFNALVGWTIAPAQGPLRLSVRSDGATGHVTASETTPSNTPGDVRAHIVQPDGSSVEVALPATAPGEYGGIVPARGCWHVPRPRGRGQRSVRAEAGLPVSYPAEFRQVTADTRRLEQIAAAGGGHVLATPAGAFANDLPPLTTPVPLQRLLVLAAAILLPLEMAIRRLRISPMDIALWLRHPHGLSFQMPSLRPSVPEQSPAWLPGMLRRRPAPRTVSWSKAPSEQPLGAHVTPGLARESSLETDEDDALAAATAWLRARRPTGGDRGSCQLSAVSRQPSAVSRQQSARRSQLSSVTTAGPRIANYAGANRNRHC